MLQVAPSGARFSDLLSGEANRSVRDFGDTGKRAVRFRMSQPVRVLRRLVTSLRSIWLKRYLDKLGVR